MRKSGFTLVEIMIVISVIVLLAAIAIPNVLRARANTNNAVARSTLRTMSTATEAYAAANAALFPTSEATLTGANPPYLNRSYCGQTYAGFSFTCTWSFAGYTFTAAPTSFGFTGTNTYTITTGAILTPAN